MVMLLYSFALALGLTLAAPWWLTRMATTQRYREGLGDRLGIVPGWLAGTVIRKQVIWLHAVSVGEVLAASRLIVELEAALGEGWVIVVSTTTRTGQQLARERFGAERVFYFPLDFARAIRPYLKALKPKALVLMESELWPRVLHECQRAGIPVVVVNARVSDRSFARAMRVRAVWGRVLSRVSLWLAQSDEDARRLVAIGASDAAVDVSGNLKYDVRAPLGNPMSDRIGGLLWKSRLFVAGSTLAGEEQLLLAEWPRIHAATDDVALLIAPRHPDRFEEVAKLIRDMKWPFYKCSHLLLDTEPIFGGTILLLDTVGDLAAMYGKAALAFVGGSLVPRGGHNPLEPAQFGVPVVMGPSFENFRDVLGKLQSVRGVAVVNDQNELRDTVIDLLRDPSAAKELGERGRWVFEDQHGATVRVVEAILRLVKP